MDLTPIQSATIQAIVRVFETGSPVGNYSALAILPDGAGISYGIVQATLNSGNLYRLIADYYLPNAPEDIRQIINPYLRQLRLREQRLNSDSAFRSLLIRLGRTPEMQAAQRRFSTEIFLRQALIEWRAHKFSLALTAGVIYDSQVHGSFTLIDHRTNPNLPERQWVRAYLEARYDWLANHPKQILHKTIYRPKFWLGLVEADNWDLDLPIEVRGVRLNWQLVEALA